MSFGFRMFLMAPAIAWIKLFGWGGGFHYRLLFRNQPFEDTRVTPCHKPTEGDE
jgi:hypothetical protein